MNNKCRNCGEGEFYSRDVSFMGEVGALLPIGLFSTRKVRVRVCGHCGLMELFVSSETLAKVKEKFTKEY
jgi:predicted nucleic-acid-binding Zn-ribbon protein